MLEPLVNQDEKDQQQVDALLNTGCPMENLRIAVKRVKIVDYRTKVVLEEIHVGRDAGMYAVVHELNKTYGRCLIDIIFINGNIEIRTKAVGEDIYAPCTK